MSIGKGGFNTKGKSPAKLRAMGRKGRETQSANRKQRNFSDEAPF